MANKIRSLSRWVQRLLGPSRLSGNVAQTRPRSVPETRKPRPCCDEHPPRDVSAIDQLTTEIRDRISGTVELPDENWMKQSGPFPSVQQFFNSAFNNFKELLHYTNLTPSHRTLDYGCGLARLAIPMSGYLDPDNGFYCGVDTDASCIERNRRVFAGHPNFRFEHVNIFSKMYNREGGNFDVLLEQDFGGPFDLAFLFSVFTHILPEHCDMMLRFLRSQLRGGGEVFSSWFLLNDETERAIESGYAHRDFAWRHGEARIDNPTVPEGAVAYYESDVMERFARAGLTDIRVHYGKWRGCEDSWVWQDIIVARATP